MDLRGRLRLASAKYNSLHREERAAYAKRRYASRLLELREESRINARDRRARLFPLQGIGNCLRCGEEFQKTGRRHKFCTVLCRRIVEYPKARVVLERMFREGRIPTTSYHGYGPEWPLISLDIRHRDNYTCRSCRATGCRLNVHHILEVDMGGTHDQSNLITLCSKCHVRGHKTQVFHFV